MRQSLDAAVPKAENDTSHHVSRQRACASADSALVAGAGNGERINVSKRKRENPDEDEMAEMKAAVETAKGIVNQVISAISHHLMQLQVDAGSALRLSILDTAHGMFFK